MFLDHAPQDFLLALPWATGGTILWILIAYKFNQSLVDMVTGARPHRRESNRKPPSPSAVRAFGHLNAC